MGFCNIIRRKKERKEREIKRKNAFEVTNVRPDLNQK